MLDKEILDSAHRQMGAIVAKALDAMENAEFFHHMHPMEGDRLRRWVLDLAWESYKVGLRAGRKTNA